MSVTQNDPGTIFLGGERTQIGDLATSVALTPGHAIERFNSSGVIQWRKATAASAGAVVCTNQSMLNKGVDDTYAIGDLVEASVPAPGSKWWMLIASGQDLAAGAKLEHAGDGTLRALASGVAVFAADENKPSVTVLTRIRVTAL